MIQKDNKPEEAQLAQRDFLAGLTLALYNPHKLEPCKKQARLSSKKFKFLKRGLWFLQTHRDQADMGGYDVANVKEIVNYFSSHSRFVASDF